MNQREVLNSPIVQRYLHELVGTEGMQVALSPPEGEVTDEEIAEDLDLEVNTVRRALIILNENKLTDYRRVRDQESGWLTYYWIFEYENIPQQLEEHMEELYRMLEKREEYEENNDFYRCSVCRDRYDFSDAYELQFTCARCSSDLNSEESGIILDYIKKRRSEIEEELVEVEQL